jgi:hypothetical protein
MIEDEIRIERIKAKSLYDFSIRLYDSAKKDGIIPIGKRRALAFSKNPYADENDIGLIVAHLGRRYIGYLGIMPGLLRAGNQYLKVHWLSTWFVTPEFRRTSVGLSLLLNALSLKYDFVVCGMSDEAEKVYRALHFRELGPLNYYVLKFYLLDPVNLSLRLGRKILRKLGIQCQIPVIIIRLYRFFWSPIITIFYEIFFRDKKNDIDNVSYLEVSEIPKDSKEKTYHPTTMEFYRDTRIINWMLKYKWTKESKEIELPDLNYYFAEIRDVFKFISLKVYSSDGKEYKGFMILSFTVDNLDSVLKILDYHFFNTKDYKYIALVAFKYASIYKANLIEFPEELITNIDDSRLLKFLCTRKERIYLIGSKNKDSPLAALFNNIKLNYCDGDTPFT